MTDLAKHNIVTDDDLHVIAYVASGAPARLVAGLAWLKDDLSELRICNGTNWATSPAIAWANHNHDAAYAALAHTHSGYPSPATIVVAASNSTTRGKTRADYTCTGTGDQATIQTAISALPATGGCIILLEGTYNLSGGISLIANTLLQGQGRSTILKLANGTSGNTRLISGAHGATVCDLAIDGNSVQGDGENAGIYSYGTNAFKARRVDIYNVYGHGIEVCGGESSPIASYTSVRDCSISGCALHGIYLHGNTAITDISDCLLFSNTLDGVRITDASVVIVRDCQVFANYQHGINLEDNNEDGGVYNCAGLGNGQQTTNTYSNIRVNGSSGFTVQGNRCNKAYGALGSMSKSGIEVTIDSSYTFVANNHLQSGGHANSLLVAGTTSPHFNVAHANYFANVLNAG